MTIRDDRGSFDFSLALNSLGQETTLLISTSQFELCAEAGDDEFEEEYNFSDNHTVEDNTSNFDSDFDEYILDNTDPKMRPASKTAIEGLEKVKIDEGLGKVETLHCLVCLEELSIEKEARRLPCSHIYHAGCIIEWLKNSNMCPLCRHKLPVVDFDLNLKMPQGFLVIPGTTIFPPDAAEVLLLPDNIDIDMEEVVNAGFANEDYYIDAAELFDKTAIEGLEKTLALLPLLSSQLHDGVPEEEPVDFDLNFTLPAVDDDLNCNSNPAAEFDSNAIYVE
ncbi:hypothetical protein CRYUN_Cryun12cG0046500 [Craigia yunnanensis]